MNNSKNSIRIKVKYIYEVLTFLWQKSHLLVIFMVIESFLIAVTPFPTLMLTKYTIDMISQEYIFQDYIKIVSILLIISFVISLLKGLFNQLISRVKVYEITSNLANDFFIKSMYVQYSLLNDNEFQEEREYAKSFIQGGCNRLIWNINNLISLILTMIFSIYFLISVDILCVILLLGMVFFQNRLQKKQFDVNRKIYRNMVENDRKYSYYNDAFCNNNLFGDFWIFNIKKIVSLKINKYLLSKHDLTNKQNKNNIKYSLRNNFINFIFMFLIYSIIFFSIIYNNKEIGYFVVAINIINLLKSSLLKISTTLNSFNDDIIYMKSFLNYMNTKKLLECEENDKNSQKTIIIDNIEFKNVSFKYPNTDVYILKNINIKINNNQKIGIIGLNGSGKTTFLKLLIGFYDVTSGEILINNINIKDYDKRTIWASMSGIFQDYKLFFFKIYENITSLKEQKDNDLFLNSIKEADLSSLLLKLPNKENTYIGKIYDKNGVELSGGESQKISFARSLYKKNASVLIFDEPTSALDPISEFNLYKKYCECCNEKITFFVSHRLSVCNICDTILYFKDGEIVGCGPHQKLLNENIDYKEMYELQRESYCREKK
ncbi:MAG TPA: ABC transporter ATP-binding protein [Bacteroidales bacterium]|jgi:ABC-type multidrug transport system fused ATPase/permease subunit|nr:ABC transporter ATP-binding protein [Bacilli bacterium]HOE15184.1 ABC transporter ATP-binding protein [Candidatus Paceibacterota bacterium]HPL02072.1 ABC transporter ATP-binding protein [Bacteroidales bacterium]HQL11803.1 ABC transporter ATP-binding protein [bacterium]HOH61028.1 ABC transporter ATP-binding protein [Bacilli bacterium]